MFHVFIVTRRQTITTTSLDLWSFLCTNATENSSLIITITRPGLAQLEPPYHTSLVKTRRLLPLTFSSLFQRISIREEMLFSNWNECRTGSQKNDSDAAEIFLIDLEHFQQQYRELLTERFNCNQAEFVRDQRLLEIKTTTIGLVPHSLNTKHTIN